MSQVKVKENESLDSALRRFKRQTSRDGVIQEVRKREHYEKPSVKRKKKSGLLVSASISDLFLKAGCVPAFSFVRQKANPLASAEKKGKPFHEKSFNATLPRAPRD